MTEFPHKRGQQVILENGRIPGFLDKLCCCSALLDAPGEIGDSQAFAKKLNAEQHAE
jgi:hypothetical protein